MSTLRVDSIRGQTADGTNRYVVQVKQFILSTAESITSTSFANSSLAVSITPNSVNSKIRATINGTFGMNFWHASPYWRMTRDSTQISFNEGTHWPRVQYDQTYTLQGRTTNGSYPLYLNRTVAVSGPMAQSTITVMEISQ
jgi:hypothetical protein